MSTEVLIPTEVSAPPPTPHPDVLPPTPDEIDAAISDYQQAQLSQVQAKATFDQAKLKIIFLVDNFGFRKTEHSLKLEGRRNTATVTRGTLTKMNEAAISSFSVFLGEKGIPALFDELFATVTSFQLKRGARKALKAVKLPQRVEEKVLSLFGRCFDPEEKSPSVSIEVIGAVKPARMRRGRKAA